MQGKSNVNEASDTHSLRGNVSKWKGFITYHATFQVSICVDPLIYGSALPHNLGEAYRTFGNNLISVEREIL